MSRLLRVLLLVWLLVTLSEIRVQADAAAPSLRPAAPPSRGEAAAEEAIAPLWGRARAIPLSRIPPALQEGPGALPAYAVVRATALPLHSAPTSGAAVLAPIPPGSQLPVRAVLADRSWLEVEWQAQRGWIRADRVALPADRPH